jgi:hypothetical protein
LERLVESIYQRRCIICDLISAFRVSGVIAANSAVIPDVLKWTETRFAGKPAGDTCSFAAR